jgi:4-amino-4-deoxy-L-arabinose transferase-like glycosyltransferase
MNSSSALVSVGVQPPVRVLYRTALAAALLVFLVFATGEAFTRRPWGDEVFTANSALNLATNGSSGMTVYEPTGPGNKPGRVVTRIDERNYHIMPLSYVGQAAWYKLFGFSLPSMRFFSVFWGVVLMLSWNYSITRLTGNPLIAVVTSLVLATDYLFVQSATDGRPDVMGAALGAAALALYLRLRENSLSLAIFVAATLLTLTALTHPIATVASIPVVIAYLLFDRHRFRWSQILVAAAPFLIGAAAYGVFILQDPVAFKAQFGVNASGRLDGLAHPLIAIMKEIGDRYLEGVYLPHYAHGVALLRVLIILVYWIAFAWLAGAPSIRKDPRYRLVLLAAAAELLLFTFFEGNKSSYYIIHVLPLFAAALAISAVTAWHSGRSGKLFASGVLSLLVLLQISWIAYSIAKNPYKNTYLPAIAFLREHAGSTASIIGSGELGFELGFDKNLRDDSSLGYFTGRKPDFVVIDENAYKQSLASYATKLPKLDNYVKQILTEQYHRVYDGPFYEIYQRNGKL